MTWSLDPIAPLFLFFFFLSPPLTHTHTPFWIFPFLYPPGTSPTSATSYQEKFHSSFRSGTALTSAEESEHNLQRQDVFIWFRLWTAHLFVRSGLYFPVLQLKYGEQPINCTNGYCMYNFHVILKMCPTVKEIHSSAFIAYVRVHGGQGVLGWKVLFSNTTVHLFNAFHFSIS